MANIVVLVFITFLISGCGMFGHSDVEIAPYTMLDKDGQFELRQYERLVLITTSMSGLDEAKNPFYKLFNYISGDNADSQKIEMTAPVFMDQTQDASEKMTFVLPKRFSLENAPQPQDPSVKLTALKNYVVATIRFTGRLSQNNIQKYKKLLNQWVEQKQFNVIGQIKAAGYNPPFTIPALRRNEILIPVEKP